MRKSFKDNNPALQFISTPDTQQAHDAQEEYEAQEALHKTPSQTVREIITSEEAEPRRPAPLLRRNTPQAQETHDTQEAQEEYEAHEAYAARTTQGKKGKKLPRMMMAFSESNMAYMKRIARLEGMSVTAYVNQLIEADRVQKQALIEQAEALLGGNRDGGN